MVGAGVTIKTNPLPFYNCQKRNQRAEGGTHAETARE